MQLKGAPPFRLFKAFPQITHFEILYSIHLEPFHLGKDR